MQDKRNTESVIQEIMVFVEDYHEYGHQSYKDAIESKLRELVESKFSVREPLSHKEACELIAECEQDGPIYILRNTELAHNITQEKQG